MHSVYIARAHPNKAFLRPLAPRVVMNTVPNPSALLHIEPLSSAISYSVSSNRLALLHKGIHYESHESGVCSGLLWWYGCDHQVGPRALELVVDTNTEKRAAQE